MKYSYLFVCGSGGRERERVTVVVPIGHSLCLVEKMALQPSKKKLRTTTDQMVTWGSKGQGDGQFEYPVGIAISSINHTIYVSDLGNKRIQCFSADSGIFLRKWGFAGYDKEEEPGSFWHPTGLAIGVFDGMNKSISNEMNQVPELYAFPPGVLPICVAYVGDEYLCVCDTHNEQIHLFDCDGTVIRRLVTTIDPHGNGDQSCAVDENGLIYISDTENSRIQVFNGNDGTFVREWKTQLMTYGGISSRPFGITLAPGSVFVADSSNGRIIRYDRDGALMSTLTLSDYPSTPSGIIAADNDLAYTPVSPTGFVISNDHRGVMYISDQFSHSVIKLYYGHTKQILRSWGGHGNTTINNPYGIALGRNGRLYVADRKNDRIVVIDDDDK
jgi:tripartite motif-containing protein 71